MAEKEKLPPEVEKELEMDPAQTSPPTPILMGQEPIPDPGLGELGEKNTNKK